MDLKEASVLTHVSNHILAVICLLHCMRKEAALRPATGVSFVNYSSLPLLSATIHVVTLLTHMQLFLESTLQS